MRGVLVVIALSTATAHADRVIIADSDPELLRAVTTTLAPWKLEVVVEDTAPTNTGEAEARAKAREARFVVWRRDGDLVVFDRERGAAEHREGTQGELDPASAMAAALTVKTLMRLPPPDAIGVAPLQSGPELRVQTMIASRVARGSTTELGGRFAAAVLVRPWGRRGFRFGIAGELGTSADVDETSFKGTWADYSVLALASYTQTLRRIELEQYVGGGVTRSSFDGVEASMERSESATLGTLRAGFAVRWRFGAWTVGPAAELDVFLGTPTYAKLVGVGDVFEVPAFAVSVGVLGAIDFGR
jgi:hypothetical protein